jgi:hypothetical protein
MERLFNASIEREARPTRAANLERLFRVNQDEFRMLIFALTVASERVNGWDKWQQYNADTDPSLIDRLLQRFVDDRFVAETLRSESESMALARRAKEDSQASALASQAAPPPDPAVSSKSDTAQRFRYATKRDSKKLKRVADRLREITARDGTGRQFDGAYDYTVRAVIEALGIGDLFYEFPVNRSDP